MRILEIGIFGELMNRYNNEIWDELDSFGEIAPIVGFDYYVYKNKFWFHTYANYILPHHKYIKEMKDTLIFTEIVGK